MILLLTLVVFIVMILLLVGFHELGHFAAALLCRVPVQRFSIGFGKPLLKWRSKRGIEYVLAWLPLGGYVKLTDERDGLAPNMTVKRSVWRWMIVVFAGPFANFLLAFLAFYCVCLLGKTLVKPVVGSVVPHSIAAKAGVHPGDEIVKVGSYRVQGWQNVRLALVSYLGEQGILKLTVKTKQGLSRLKLPLKHWQINQYNPALLMSLGLVPKVPKQGQTWPASALVTLHYTPLSAIGGAWQQTWSLLRLNAIVLWKLLIGQMSLKVLAGPVTLFKTAEVAARAGLVVFFSVLAVLSIGIGFINLLPIPGLDGAQLVYLVIEKVRGHSMTVASEVLLFKIGMILVAVLMFQSLANDLVRLFA